MENLKLAGVEADFRRGSVEGEGGRDNGEKNPFVAENEENEKVVLNKLELLFGPRVPAFLQACQPTQKRNPIN